MGFGTTVGQVYGPRGAALPESRWGRPIGWKTYLKLGPPDPALHWGGGKGWPSTLQNAFRGQDKEPWQYSVWAVRTDSTLVSLGPLCAPGQSGHLLSVP